MSQSFFYLYAHGLTPTEAPAVTIAQDCELDKLLQRLPQKRIRLANWRSNKGQISDDPLNIMFTKMGLRDTTMAFDNVKWHIPEVVVGENDFSFWSKINLTRVKQASLVQLYTIQCRNTDMLQRHDLHTGATIVRGFLYDYDVEIPLALKNFQFVPPVTEKFMDLTIYHKLDVRSWVLIAHEPLRAGLSLGIQTPDVPLFHEVTCKNFQFVCTYPLVGDEERLMETTVVINSNLHYTCQLQLRDAQQDVIELSWDVSEDLGSWPAIMEAIFGCQFPYLSLGSNRKTRLELSRLNRRPLSLSGNFTFGIKEHQTITLDLKLECRGQQALSRVASQTLLSMFTASKKLVDGHKWMTDLRLDSSEWEAEGDLGSLQLHPVVVLSEVKLLYKGFDLLLIGHLIFNGQELEMTGEMDPESSNIVFHCCLGDSSLVGLFRQLLVVKDPNLLTKKLQLERLTGIHLWCQWETQDLWFKGGGMIDNQVVMIQMRFASSTPGEMEIQVRVEGDRSEWLQRIFDTQTSSWGEQGSEVKFRMATGI